MSGLPSQHSYQNPDSNKLDQIDSTKKKNLFNSVTDSEEFYNPFSDLNLFLANKIKKEIQANGSTLKWSRKVETNLLAKILPEFKKQFPKYRIGSSALKKIWEKVSYYYDKIQNQKNALLKNGNLNLEFIIRENLKSYSSAIVHHPYSQAQHIAAKIGECIATIEGKCPHVDHLSQVIWAIQKHLIKNLSSQHSRSPYEDYDSTDKLVVKTLLEITSFNKNYNQIALKQEIYKDLSKYEGIKKLIKNNQLTSSLSMAFAKKTYGNLINNTSFSSNDLKKFESFINYQIKLSNANTALSYDTTYTELVQHILALYSISRELPRNIEDQILQKSIRKILDLKEKKGSYFSKEINSALFVFINAQMHLINENKEFDNLLKIESILFNSCKIAIELPYLNSTHLEKFELILWNQIQEQNDLFHQLDSDLLNLLDKELGNIVAHNPNYSFRMVISSALQFFKTIQHIDLSHKKLDNKIEVWATQNDMLIRWIHFNEKSPILLLLQEIWKNEYFFKNNINYEEFINATLKAVLKKYPILNSFKKSLENRLWILFKYLWYTKFTNGKESTYERFLEWHRGMYQSEKPEGSKKDIDLFLKKISHELVPLAPFIELHKK